MFLHKASRQTFVNFILLCIWGRAFLCSFFLFFLQPSFVVNVLLAVQLPLFILEKFPLMHQSIPAVPIPPPGISRAFAHVSIPGVGHLKFYHCPGVGHLPTPRTNPRAFDIFVRFWSQGGYSRFK